MSDVGCRMADVKGGCMKKCSCGRELSAGQTVHFECWKRQFDARMREMQRAIPVVKKVYAPKFAAVKRELVKA